MHQAWILSSNFVTDSLKAGIMLPEYQFLVKRITNQGKLKILSYYHITIYFNINIVIDILEPPLETQEKDDSNQMYGSHDTDLTEMEVLPELQDRLLNFDGGQVWGIEPSSSISSKIEIHYLLGPAFDLNIDDNNHKKEEKKSSIHISSNSSKYSRLQKSKRKKRKLQSKSKKNSTKKQDKEKEIILIDDNDEDDNFQIEYDNNISRSDEELFICVAPWGQNTLMVSQEGKLWIKIGLKTPKLMKFESKNPICSIVCGKSHALALSIAGEVYSWGSSYAGQLGHGHKITRIAKPKRITKILGNMPILQLAASGDSSAVLTRLGGVYMWGGNRDGKLGVSTNNKNIHIPTLVKFPDNFENEFGPISKIICGDTHSMALTKFGGLFSWGSNRYGQLGIKTSKPFCNFPQIVNFNYNNSNNNSEIIIIDKEENNQNNIIINEADCGLFHSAAICKNGNLYTWGLARKGALGHGSKIESELYPRLVEWFKNNNIKLSNVQCGDFLTSIVDENELLYIIGKIGKESEELLPFCIPNLNSVTDFYCNKSRIGLLIRGANALLQRHAIEGNLEPFQTLSQYLCDQDNSYYYKLHEKILDMDGNNLLHLACYFNQDEIVKYILFKFPEFDPNFRNNNGYATIHICSKYNYVKCLKHLLIHPKIDINLKTISNNNNNIIEKDASIHIAVEENSDDSLRLLVFYGADKIIRNNNEDTALHIAVKKNRYSEFLIWHAASVTEKDKLKRDPLSYCDWDTRTRLMELAENNEIFISYAHVDHKFALKVRKALNNFSLRCWMDDWRLEAGDDWRAAIGKGLIGSKIVVFIASKNSVISDWCLKELYLAQELSRKIVLVLQDDVSDHYPILDLKISTLLKHSKSKDIFDFTKVDNTVDEKSENNLSYLIFKENIENLARRLHGLVENYQKNHNTSIINQETNYNEENYNLLKENNLRRQILSKKSLYVCFSYSKNDVSFVSWIKSRLKEHKIQSIDINEIRKKSKTNRLISEEINERMIITNAWAYILILSPSILKSERVQQQLEWIEQSKGKVNVILLYFDAEKDYMKIFSKDMFSIEQLRKISELFSFCIDDKPWLNQLMYTLNLMRKQTLLDRHIDLLMKRIENFRQQTSLIEEQTNKC